MDFNLSKNQSWWLADDVNSCLSAYSSQQFSEPYQLAFVGLHIYIKSSWVISEILFTEGAQSEPSPNGNSASTGWYPHELHVSADPTGLHSISRVIVERMITSAYPKIGWLSNRRTNRRCWRNQWDPERWVQYMSQETLHRQSIILGLRHKTTSEREA